MSEKNNMNQEQQEEQILQQESESTPTEEQQVDESTEDSNISLDQKDVEEEKQIDAEPLDEVEAQQQKIENLEQELTETKDKLLRKVAEMDNMRKRLQREKTQIFESAKAAALEDFLPINDDLLRTLAAADGLEVDDKFLDGVQMIAQKFENVLEKHNVERIDETGVPFDVDKHDAMMRQKPQDENVDSNTVLQVLENGYRIGDRTIRHAKVIVSE
ncbi:MAG: nucleotide exchange factor GrpE [Bacteroidota bacterium]